MRPPLSLRLIRSAGRIIICCQLRNKKLWGCSKTTRPVRPRPRPGVGPDLVAPVPVPGLDGTASDGAVTFSSVCKPPLQSQRRHYPRIPMISRGPSRVFSQIMGRTMEVGGTDSNFPNNVAVPNYVPRGSQNPPSVSQHLASRIATSYWIYTIIRRRELGISPKPRIFLDRRRQNKTK